MFTHTIEALGAIVIGDILLGVVVSTYLANRYGPTEHLKGMFQGLLIGGISAFWCGVLVTAVVLGR